MSLLGFPLVIRINIVLVFYYLVGLLLFWAQTPGFDLYSHGFMHYYYDEPYLGSYNVFGIQVPRYLLLSYSYGFGRIIGIPSGWIAFLIWTMPVYALYKYFKTQQSLKFSDLIVWVFIFLAALKYSSLLIGAVWLISYYLTGRKFLLIGIFFHPLLLVVLPLLFLNIIKKLHLHFFITSFFLVVILNYFNNIYGMIALDPNYKGVINFDNFPQVIYLAQRKSEYLFIIVSLILILNLKKKLKIDKIIVKIFPFLLLFLAYGFVFFFDKSPGLVSFFGDQYEYLDMTWFDFGTRDYAEHDKIPFRELRNIHNAN
jgi:hypothetical protein